MHLGSADILYKVFRPCFGLISGISNTGHGCQGVVSVFSFLRFVCICALIVVQPHSPLQDRKKRLFLYVFPATPVPFICATVLTCPKYKEDRRADIQTLYVDPKKDQGTLQWGLEEQPLRL